MGGLRHFKSIKVSHTYHRSNSLERKRDYTVKTEEEKHIIQEGIRDNILFQNCPQCDPPFLISTRVWGALLLGSEQTAEGTGP
jgi:hypothetical protein